MEDKKLAILRDRIDRLKTPEGYADHMKRYDQSGRAWRTREALEYVWNLRPSTETLRRRIDI